MNFLGKIPVLKEFEWFEWFEWFGPSPTEPFNSGEASFHERVGSFRPGGYQQATDRVATAPLVMDYVFSNSELERIFSNFELA